MNLKLIAVACLVVALASASGYTPNVNVTLPAGVFEVEYSPDEVYLGVAAPNTFTILFAKNGSKVQNIQIDLLTTLKSFAFSSDSQKLVLGINDGAVLLYEYNSTLSLFIESNIAFVSETQSDVSGVCFMQGDQFVVIGIKTAGIVVWDVEENQYWEAPFGTSAFLFTVVCSPMEMHFAAGGGQGVQGVVTVYIFDANATQKISVQRTVDQGIPTVEGIFYSKDGQNMYGVGNSDNIFIFNNAGNKTIPITGATIPFYKVRVSDDETLIVTVDNSNTIYVVNNSEAVNFINLKAESRQTNLESITPITGGTIPSFALSSLGSKLFSVSGTTGSISGQCEIKYYLDSSGCLPCNDECEICETAADICYECAVGAYLDGTSCKACSIGCSECKDINDCTLCSDADNFEPDGTGGCKCKKRFYLIDKACSGDCIVGCDECEDGATCTNCYSPFIPTPELTCGCPEKMFISNKTCEDCIRGCLSCPDADSCNVDKCSDADHYIYNPDGQNCTCNDAEHFEDNQDNTACVCMKGFFQTAQGLCQACGKYCLDCTSETECTECPGQLVASGGECVCADPTDYIDANLTCQSCGAEMQHCIKCETANTCELCETGTNRHPEGNRCVCDPDFFEQGGVCLACEQPGCLICNNTETCLSCNQTAHWFLNETTNVCGCVEEFVEVVDTCEACPAGCLSCSDVDSCDVCKQDWQVDANGTCECIPGFYRNENQCIQCMPGCEKCQVAGVCDVCENTAFVKIQNACECRNGTYLNNRECLSCSIMNLCERCTNDHNCTKCVAPFIFVKPSVCGCAKGTYRDGAKCTKCPEECSECEAKNKCTACTKKDYSPDGGICKKNGLDALVIVLIVVGVLAVAGAVFALVKCVKKKRTTLDDEEYDKL